MKRLYFLLLCLPSWTLGCSSSSTTDSSDDSDDGPAALTIDKVQNIEGAGSFDELVLDCDGNIALTFGPRDEDDEILANWNLQPPDGCSEDDQPCGYIDISVKQRNEVLFSTQTILVRPLLKVPGISGDVEIEATLVQGNTREPWTEDDEVIAVTKTVTLVSDCD